MLFKQTSDPIKEITWLEAAQSQRFAEVYSLKKRNEYISFVKALAILTIVLYHFLFPIPMHFILSKLVGLGGGGVHLFIFASGYGLYLSKYTSYFQFLKKRFAKVVIPYFLTIGFIFLVNIFIQIFPTDGFDAFFSHIFFYKMFIENFEGSFGGQFWFMSTIIQLYLLFPALLFFILRNNSMVCLLSLIVISLLYATSITILGYGELRIVNSFFIQYIWEFALGIIIAKENLMDKIVAIKWYYVLSISIAAYTIMAFLTLFFGALGRNINDVFSFLGYGFFSILCYQMARLNKTVLNWFNAVEPISYALFLTHTFVYTVMAKYFFTTVHFFEAGLIFVMSVVVAKVFNKLIQKVNASINL